MKAETRLRKRIRRVLQYKMTEISKCPFCKTDCYNTSNLDRHLNCWQGVGGHELIKLDYSVQNALHNHDFTVDTLETLGVSIDF